MTAVEQVPAGKRLVWTGAVVVCCESHRRGDLPGAWPDRCDRGPCCDPDDCGPCCPECPTCPSLPPSEEIRREQGRFRRQRMVDWQHAVLTGGEWVPF